MKTTEPTVYGVTKIAAALSELTDDQEQVAA